MQALKRALVINGFLVRFDPASRIEDDIPAIAYRRSEELVENQFLTAFIRASLSNGRRRPLFENFSLLALLHDCT